MRYLPDNPNLDFLRQEAKDLLAALREGDPKAALSEAQRAVAEQYGFRTWPELKAEVERRRSAPPVADPALALELAAAFDLGDVNAPLTPISYTFMGRRWRLETDQGVWQAGPVVEWMGDDQVARATELRERARAVGVLATLTPFESGHLTYRHTDTQWDDLIAGTSAAGKPWADDLIRLREGPLRALEAVPFRHAAEPLVVSIADLSIGAVRMGPHDNLVLVHWDFAGPHLPEWELAYVLTHWAIYGPASPGAARAIVAGYRDRAGSVPALDLSSFWLTITAHPNWTYNQFCTARGAVGDEQRAYVEGELRDLIADPLTVTKIEQLLEELNL